MTVELLRKVDVPQGVSGDWSVQRYTVTVEKARTFNLGEETRDQRFIRPGTYTRLTHKGQVVMEDTPAELADLRTPIDAALHFSRVGAINVLVTGLGLGVVVQSALDLRSGGPGQGGATWSRVNHLTVVEKERDVVLLVGPHYTERYGSERLTIIHADAFELHLPVLPCRSFTVGWHDIWAKNSPDAQEQSKLLHAKYASRCNWQGSWCRETTEAIR